MNVTGDTGTTGENTEWTSVTSCGDHGELKQFSLGVSDELAWCIQEMTGGTESTGYVRQAKQLVVWSAYGCHGHRGMMYQRQICRAERM